MKRDAKEFKKIDEGVNNKPAYSSPRPPGLLKGNLKTPNSTFELIGVGIVIGVSLTLAGAAYLAKEVNTRKRSK